MRNRPLTRRPALLTKTGTAAVPVGRFESGTRAFGSDTPFSGAVRPAVAAGVPGGLVQRAPLTPKERAVDLTSGRFRNDRRLQRAFDNTPPMGFGEAGEAVRKVQQALLDLGFDMPITTRQGTREPDGVFGAETRRTVKAFQTMQGIARDGIVGRQTLGELEGRLTGRPATGTPAPFTVPPGSAIHISTVDKTPPRFDPCTNDLGYGKFIWEVTWRTNARNGYIVQEMASAQQGEFCTGGPDAGVAPGAPLFWEAWRVQQDGTVHPPPGRDTWQVPVPPAHRGTWQLTGRVFFVAQLDPAAGFKTGNLAAPQAGTLYATAQRPAHLGPVLMTRHAAGRWDCCGDRRVHEPRAPSGAAGGGGEAGAVSGGGSARPAAAKDGGLAPPPTGGGGSPCPPGYTQCDFIDPRLSVGAQYALYELYRRGAKACADAVAMLSAARSAIIQGVYKADERRPAQMAQRHGTHWWKLVPPGRGAMLFEQETPPMMVFRKHLATERRALATALQKAWNASMTGQSAIPPWPPSLKPCPARPSPPPLPPEQKRACPPGTLPDPSGTFCHVPLPGQANTECTDAQMATAFQRQEDFCASVYAGLDLICKLGPGACDLGGPFTKAACEAYEKFTGKPAPGSKPAACNEPRGAFYENCIVNTLAGGRSAMPCFPGTTDQIREKYRRWPGREQ
ncbi:MAG TPA: peptidoglycan-binding protein [Gammaproteobacteria bacterium]|nr:peptidoglycan-binding protein [Gammaproteobacteria bacterium]